MQVIKSGAIIYSMAKNRLLVLGGTGGREHAIGWNINKSGNVEVLYAPGNAGTETDGMNIDIDRFDFPAVSDAIAREGVGLTVVGPDALLEKGVVDYLTARGHRVYGPSREAARLEWDKFFSYDVMHELHMPQARSVQCRSVREAANAIKKNANGSGIVLKARGLTGGKGVGVFDTMQEALRELHLHAEKYGQEMLVAERLVGEEVSVFGLSDGERVVPIIPSFQDYKRLLDDDKGPNTGGMGAYGPATVAPPDVVRYVAETMMTPIVHWMKKQGHEYRGFLYGGLMKTRAGWKVLEWNARLGDPETQALAMMVDNLYEIVTLSQEGRLREQDISYNPGAACCVVIAAPGYPDDPQTGRIITGIDDTEEIKGVKVFHAGTRRRGDDTVSSGGRLLGVTGYSPLGIREAQALAYQATPKIRVEGGSQYRRDIGNRAFR